jgi:hypothetical protein
LAGSLDDLADLPEFKPYPAGAHEVTISFAKKVVAKHPSVELNMKAIQTMELAEPAAEGNEPLQAGAETSVLFMLDNEIGQGKLKEVLKPLRDATGISDTNALLEAANGMTVVVVTKKRENQKEKGVFYTDIVSLSVQ